VCKEVAIFYFKKESGYFRGETEKTQDSLPPEEGGARLRPPKLKKKQEATDVGFYELFEMKINRIRC
jgi:hypothetical protein